MNVLYIYDPFRCGRCAIRSGLCSPNQGCLAELVQDADDKLFSQVLYIIQ